MTISNFLTIGTIICCLGLGFMLGMFVESHNKPNFGIVRYDPNPDSEYQGKFIFEFTQPIEDIPKNKSISFSVVVQPGSSQNKQLL